MEKLNAIRESLRAALFPTNPPIDWDVRNRRIHHLMGQLPLVEQRVWKIVWEGDPSRLAEYLLLFKATQAEVRCLASNIRRSTQHSLALWPDIPRSWRIRNQSTEARWLMDLPQDAQQKVLNEWGDDQNQDDIIEALGWYTDSSMGFFFIRTGVDARVLSVALARHMVYPVEGSALLPPIPVFPVMKSVAEAGIWIGRYIDSDRQWAFVSGAAGAGNELIQLCAGMETASLLKHDGDTWSLVSGKIE